jgi:antitoxin component of RelBE/YafQ-DinJ toxin-antitoxin module
MVSVRKEKTNLYLNKDLKEQAKEKLSKYGLTLSSFTNLMLAKFLRDDLELLLPNETKQVFEDFESKRNFEAPKSFEEFLEEIK